MKIDVIVGLQWGDEGKGKMIDALSLNYDIVARYQGGPNAGHTILFNEKKIVLHTLPSGICRAHCMNAIGSGVVIDPMVLRKEVAQASAALGVDEADICKRVVISSKAALITPTHILLDKRQEEKKGRGKIGSTLKGIGPCYTDKIGRNALLVGQILQKDFDKISIAKMKEHLQMMGSEDEKVPIDDWLGAIEWMKNFSILNTEIFINTELKKGKRILAEGAQGSMLDVNFGTYPYVTSSNTIASGACTGLGVSPHLIGKIFGVAKAYTTRVGEGPFPTEQTNKIGEYLQQKGYEIGSTTGRKRRCGWLDLPLLRYAIMINGATDLMLMKVDVLAGMEKIDIANSYRYRGETYKIAHSDCDFLKEAEVVYDSFPAWEEGARFSLEDKKCASFIEYIEKQIEIPISYISYGANRNELLTMAK